MLQGVREFFIATGTILLIRGFGIWLFARPYTIHIGASGLIFGYIGFLLLHGYFESSWFSVAFSVIVLFLYGRDIRGIFPSEQGISWEGHLFGFFGGLLAARFVMVLRIMLQGCLS